MWERLGGIDLLVNNAGIGMRTVNPRFLSDPQPFWEVPPDGFRDVLETKVTGCFLMARAVVPLMLEQGGGHIVMISMSEAAMVRRGFVPYGPSGAAVEALSRVMAQDEHLHVGRADRADLRQVPMEACRLGNVASVRPRLPSLAEEIVIGIYEQQPRPRRVVSRAHHSSDP